MTFEEFPVFIPTEAGDLSAVVCVPTGEMRPTGVVLLPSSAATRVHRNRMWVVAARDLAERGFPSIRVDYRGSGDSTGSAEFFALEEPFEADAQAGARFLLETTGASDLVLAGTCFGTRCAMRAVGGIPEARGVTVLPSHLADGNVEGQPRLRTRFKRWLRRREVFRHLLRRDAVLRARKKVASRHAPGGERISPTFVDDLVAFLDRGPVRFIYGTEDLRLPQLEACLEQVRARLTPAQQDRLEVDLIPDRWLEKFHSLEDQRITVEQVVASVEDVAAGLAAPS